ncbi:ABC transporter ATP-binding protein [Anaerofustis stercorihominis]|uniref:ABC transporter, ATP-binding protein n=2 Tax=Anaerofustis stercorihominis TaxID=214853 RepID=B1C612_9FIRM|nr:ABC transporter ATP-binding protein [Anaerofustis stercorihominis]EDS73581.1 ABC transporter, ATP-binding protein [Anaerofustis stercorihominis DSM 17244]MCQ4794617.1 ABC transporter ATP-binding protein [Anaerofustis stercorihominis]
MSVIKIENLTKDYGSNKGVFDLSFEVKKGEVLGFLGPNGAGKTTTIRTLLGFIKGDRGSVSIDGLDPFKNAEEVNKSLGYLPGENSLMDEMKGDDFIKFIADMKGMNNLDRADELKEFFELDASGKIKKMSKGMKQKIGIVCAFMNSPDILILDEPTSGLDPLMQNKFVELILKEKERGATILMSSHIFEEIEKTCDRSVIIKNGRLVLTEDINKLKENKNKNFRIEFKNEFEAKNFAAMFMNTSIKDKVVKVGVKGNMDEFIKKLASFDVIDIDIEQQSLEELFMHFYGGENND